MENVEEMKLTRLFPVLDEKACADNLRRVHELREHWTRRTGNTIFYTLGAASYLDATDGRFDHFREMAVVTNPILRNEFGPLLQAVLDALGSYVGEEVRIAEELSVPGFHIFLAEEFGAKSPSASLHFDLQYANLRWDAHGGEDPATQISFTMPLALPKNGGGLLVWNLNWEETRKLLPTEHAKKLKDRGEPEYVAYQNGVLAVHGGHHLHQIAPFKDHTPADERTTLQGHAIRCRDGWWAYW